MTVTTPRAAHAHDSAAEAHDKQDHQPGHENSRQALEHSRQVYQHEQQVLQETVNERGIAIFGQWVPLWRLRSGKAKAALVVNEFCMWASAIIAPLQIAFAAIAS